MPDGFCKRCTQWQPSDIVKCIRCGGVMAPELPPVLVGHLSAEPFQAREDDLIRRDDEAKSREGHR